jgi:hypothetical protein
LENKWARTKAKKKRIIHHHHLLSALSPLLFRLHLHHILHSRQADLFLLIATSFAVTKRLTIVVEDQLSLFDVIGVLVSLALSPTTLSILV